MRTPASRATRPRTLHFDSCQFGRGACTNRAARRLSLFSSLWSMTSAPMMMAGGISIEGLTLSFYFSLGRLTPYDRERRCRSGRISQLFYHKYSSCDSLTQSSHTWCHMSHCGTYSTLKHTSVGKPCCPGPKLVGTMTHLVRIHANYYR